MGLKYLVQEHDTMTRPGLKPRPLDRESSVLTVKATHDGGDDQKF